MIALQVRGGPEPYMVSSWIQILRVRLTDAGVYSCLVVRYSKINYVFKINF